MVGKRLKRLKKNEEANVPSGRLINSKLLCSETEVKRNNKTEMRWNKNVVSLSSLDTREIRHRLQYEICSAHRA